MTARMLLDVSSGRRHNVMMVWYSVLKVETCKDGP
jgi:hypothetical protein